MCSTFVAVSTWNVFIGVRQLYTVCLLRAVSSSTGESDCFNFKRPYETSLCKDLARKIGVLVVSYCLVLSFAFVVVQYQAYKKTHLVFNDRELFELNNEDKVEMNNVYIMYL